MHKFFGVFFALLVISGQVHAAGAVPAKNQELNDLYKREMEPAREDTIGISILPYYDPILPYQKTGFGTQSGQFAYQNQAGLSGVQMMLNLTHGNFEISSGIDYTFNQSIQGSQTPAFVWPNGVYINSQQLSMMGIKLLQLGYRMPANAFSVVPYVGVGVYYGKNVLELGSTSYGSNDTVTYSKLFGTVSAGARLEYNILRNLTLGVAVEVYQPFKLADQLSQNGVWALVGSDDVLKGNTDFAFNFGGRIMASAGVSF